MKKDVGCPVETTLRVIGGRWKVLVIHHLLDGVKRFGELNRALKGVSARTLTKQLRELEADGVIDRKVYQQIPPMVEYSLTAVGEKLEPILPWRCTSGARSLRHAFDGDLFTSLYGPSPNEAEPRPKRTPARTPNAPRFVVVDAISSAVPPAIAGSLGRAELLCSGSAGRHLALLDRLAPEDKTIPFNLA